MSTRSRRRRLLPLVCLSAALLAAVAACTGVPGSPSAQTPPTTERHPPSGPVPAGLDSFYNQALTWGGCQSYATDDQGSQLFGAADLQCARLTVPLDYSQPKGKTITIGVLRIKATDQGKRIGSLLMNPGGPGGSGMEAAAGMTQTWSSSPLSQRFDLVGFDPRGIGASQPAVRCLTGAQTDAERVSDLDDDPSPQGVAEYQAQQKAYANDCVTNTPDGTAMLANVGTVDAAKDLDVLRSVLGDKQLTYLGYSYGTLLGTTYAEQFPKNVRAMILDGAVDPTESPVAQLVGQGKGFQTAFNQFAIWCAKQSSCALGTNPANATQTFRNLVNPLLVKSVPVGDGRQLAYDDATTGVVQALYSETLWNDLNAGLLQLKQDNGLILMELADNYNGRNANGSYSNEQDAFTAIRCVDGPPVTDPTTLLAESQQYRQAAPFLDDGRPPVAEQDACSYWPVPPTDQPHLPNVPGLAPTLVISTTNDPATPYQSGVNLANALHGGLLTYESTQHTAFLQGNACVDKWGANYLMNLKLPPAGTRCSS
ncbi:MAG TPA: alpha/beta hydrolase [Pseudonocardiaceae bacterium]|nr:alpha/beta hydrolase [Pseudonocardiaceae bacterium]